MDAGQLVGDDIDDRHRAGAAVAAGRGRGLRARRVSAHGGAGDGARHDASTAARRSWSVNIEVPEEALVERLTPRRICANCGWNAVPGMNACARVRRRRSVPAAATTASTIVRERLRVYARDTQPLVEFYAGAADVPVGRRRLRRRTPWRADSGRGACASVGEERTRDHLPLGGRDREDAARPNQLVARRRSRSCEAAVAPGVTTADLDRLAERLVRDGGADAGVQGLPRVSRDAVRVGERGGRARDSVGDARAGGRRHHLARHGREARRVTTATRR